MILPRENNIEFADGKREKGTGQENRRIYPVKSLGSPLLQQLIIVHENTVLRVVEGLGAVTSAADVERRAVGRPAVVEAGKAGVVHAPQDVAAVRAVAPRVHQIVQHEQVVLVEIALPAPVQLPEQGLGSAAPRPLLDQGHEGLVIHLVVELAVDAEAYHLDGLAEGRAVGGVHLRGNPEFLHRTPS